MDEIFELELDNGKNHESDSDYDMDLAEEDSSSQGSEKNVEILPDNVNPVSTKISPQDFELKKVLGQGGYGKVYQVKKLTGADIGEIFAMKVVKKAFISVKDRKHTKTERNILKDVRHPFIVELYYAFQTNGKLYLILEFLNGGELFSHLSKEVLFNQDTTKFYLCELILAIQHLHSMGIIYRDLKSENVLLDKDGHIKLTDFGLSKQHLQNGSVTHTFCGTIEYMAPEILLRVGYAKEVDWWSLGALMYDMLHGSPPFTAPSREQTIQKIIRCRLHLPLFFTSEAKSLLRLLLKKQPNKRLGYGEIDAEAVKGHFFFKAVNWDDVLAKRLEPPIKPNVRGKEDCSMFDPIFTSKSIAHSPDEERQFSQSVNLIFEGFTYTAPSMLGEMRDFNLPSSPSTIHSSI